MGPGDPDFDLAAPAPGQHQAGSMALLAVLLCTLVRGAKLQEAKARRSPAASHLAVLRTFISMHLPLPATLSPCE